MIRMQLVSVAPIVTALGWSVCVLALLSAFRVELAALRNAHPVRLRIASGVMVAIIGSAVLIADQPFQVFNGCTEAHLRMLCGDWWWQCGLVAGCWLPGGG